MKKFYVHFFNLLFGYALKNINTSSHNVEGIDLIDTVSKIVLQVSSTATKQKIESALSKNLSSYKNHKFNFISISKDASSLRSNNYHNPHALLFIPQKDIHDVKSILDIILHSDIVKQQLVYEFLSKELKSDINSPIKETNVASIINVISKENLNSSSIANTDIPFNVDDKLKFNNLQTAKMVIEDYKIYHSRINKIYSEFDLLGQNKSKSVLDALRNNYIKLSRTYDSDELFFQLVDLTVNTVQQSSNYIPMPLEELELCVNVIVVDAFIRCKIFKNPMAVENVVA